MAARAVLVSPAGRYMSSSSVCVTPFWSTAEPYVMSAVFVTVGNTTSRYRTGAVPGMSSTRRSQPARTQREAEDTDDTSTNAHVSSPNFVCDSVYWRSGKPVNGSPRNGPVLFSAAQQLQHVTPRRDRTATTVATGGTAVHDHATRRTRPGRAG